MQNAGLKREYVHDRTKWREGVQTIAMRNIRPAPLTGQNWIKIRIIIIVFKDSCTHLFGDRFKTISGFLMSSWAIV